MSNLPAKILSVLFHPLLMPTYGMIILFTQVDLYFVLSIQPKAQLIISGLVFLNTFVIPSIIIAYLYSKGKISDVQISMKEERWIPLVITSILYMSTYYLLRNIGLNRFFLLVMATAILAIVISFIINIWWKISVHMIGIGGLTGAIYCIAASFNTNLNPTLILAFILAGFLGYSRLKLKQHTLAQVLVGYCTGFGISLGLLGLTL